MQASDFSRLSSANACINSNLLGMAPNSIHVSQHASKADPHFISRRMKHPLPASTCWGLHPTVWHVPVCV